MIISGCAGKEKNKGRKAMQVQIPISNEENAIKLAKHLTNLDAISKKISAERIKIVEDNTPFLWKQFIGKQAWQVKFEDGSLKLKSAIPGFQDKYKRNFIVLLDEATGKLLKVQSKYEGEAPEMRPAPTGASAEAQLRGDQENYLGLPTTNPHHNFLEALDLVLSKGVGSPFLAKEINGVYVIHTKMNSDPKPVWVITLRGLPPIPIGGPQEDAVPEWQRNHMRNVIDDVAGIVLFATNNPHPI
jgi:hypothetical protein